MKYIKDIKPDEKIESVYLLKKKELKRTKENKPYLTMVLADKTGAIEAKVWDDADTVEMRIGGASAVHIKGVVVKYRENIQFKVDHIRPADENEYSPSDLIRSLENPEEIFDKIVGYIKSIENKWLNLLAMAILDDVDLREKFMRSPGAQNWHNAYIGGLMEHTYEVMYITDHVCSLYRRPAGIYALSEHSAMI
jgi:3'-5' exoribonuclease